MSAKKFEELEQIMARLRAKNGCSWDIKQTHESLKQYLLEEVAEVLDAIDEGDVDSLKEELGDVLLQVAFHSQIASEKGEFDLFQVAETLNQKLIRRHPHVFGKVENLSAEGVVEQWDEIKKEEKAEVLSASVLDSVPKHLSALHRADKVLGKMKKSKIDSSVLVADDQEMSQTFEKLLCADESVDLSNSQMQRMLLGLVDRIKSRGANAEELLRSEIRTVSERFMALEEEADE